jgi:hypothetical protein
MKIDVEPKQILKDLHNVLIDAQTRFKNEFVMQEVLLNDAFKQEFKNYLLPKKYTVEYFDYTTVVTNSFNQQIYIANQWFVIASYFVDFCAEMISYRELFVKTCSQMGYGSTNMKVFATRVRTAPTFEDKRNFISSALYVLQSEFPAINDDYQKVAELLWKFVSNYHWWSGNKTVDRHDFYISALLNQMNVVNANAEFLALITLAYASVFKLRLLIEHVDNFTIGFEKNNANNAVKHLDISPYVTEESYQPLKIGKTGISISAASLERFRNNN